MTVQECRNRERIFKKLIEKLKPTSKFDSNDLTLDELACIELAVKRSIAIEQMNIADLKKKDGEENVSID